MRRDDDRPDSHRDPRRRRAEIGAAALVDQGGGDQPGDQKDRPVFAQHGGGRSGAGERGVERAARRVAAQKPQRGRRPSRHQHGVDVELQRMEIEKRNERQQRQAENSFFDVEIIGRQPPDDPQRQRRHQHRQEVVGPRGDGKHAEPQPHDRSGERRMLVAPGEMPRPVEQLGHVGMQALAAFGDGAVDCPQHPIGGKRQQNAALAPRRIDERGAQAVDGLKQVHGRLYGMRERYSSTRGLCPSP